MTLAQFGSAAAGGYIYITKADGTSIVTTVPNNYLAWGTVQDIMGSSASLTTSTVLSDPTYGFRVFGDTAGVVGVVSGTELTGLLTNRGEQAAAYKVAVTLNADFLIAQRVSNNMLIVLDTEGASATDTCSTITIVGAIENDVITIVAASAARVITITETGGGVINLTNDADFITGDRAQQITLRYVSGDWSEVSRAAVSPTVANARAVSVPLPVNGVNSTALGAGGGTINVTAGVDKGTQVYTGTANLAASWVIQPNAAPATPYLDGDEIWIIYNSALTSATGAETVTIFGILLSQQQAIAGAIIIRAIYKLSNTTWYSDIVYSNPKTTQIWANAAARAAAIPDFDGQMGVQLDTDKAYLAASTAINSWILVDPSPASGGDTYVLQKTVAGVLSYVPNANVSQYLRASAAYAPAHSVVLTNIPGLSANTTAGLTYSFEAILYTTSDVAAGVQFAIAGTTTATSIIYEAIVIQTTSISAHTRATSLGTQVGAVTAVTTAICRITGTITVNAAGTLTVQFAQNVDNAAASTVLIGSTFTVTQVT